MIRLADLAACFEGVVPSIIATTSADGTPNISYLSHVTRVDDDHVALSNQFFSKTAANIRENPRATLLIVDARNGAQFRLDLAYEGAQDSGATFDEVKAQLDASSAQVGMSAVMRLRSIDLYRVLDVAEVRSPVPVAPAARAQTHRPALALAADVAETLSTLQQVDDIVDALLELLCRQPGGYASAMLLTYDTTRRVLTTIGSRGYAATGVGAEVMAGEGIIGAVADKHHTIKVNDLSRVRRFGSAILGSTFNEEKTRSIALPGLPDAMSQIGVPMMVQGRLYGVLFVESRERLAFLEDSDKALNIIARQAGAALVMAEALAHDTHHMPVPAHAAPPAGKACEVTHFPFDDSVFIDGAYVIKGVPGRLLLFMLEAWQREGRSGFSNRELRLADALRLPDIKDNLETRLLLLRRRLVEKRCPIQLERAGRGRITLQVSGPLVLKHAGD